MPLPGTAARQPGGRGERRGANRERARPSRVRDLDRGRGRAARPARARPGARLRRRLRPAARPGPDLRDAVDRPRGRRQRHGPAQAAGHGDRRRHARRRDRRRPAASGDPVVSAETAYDKALLGPPIAGPSALGGGFRRFIHLARTLAVTDFKLRFFGSLLGYFWQLGRPLMLFGVLYAVFTQFLRLGNDVAHYP